MQPAAHPPVTAVREAVARALAEDLTPLGDLTASLLDPALQATARFVAREAGVLAGTDCVTEAFAQVDPRVDVEWDATDGDRTEPGVVVGAVTGPLRPILTGERTALNFLGHLSGVATATRRFVEAAAPLRVWDTRKTTPGLRALEKAAVRAGGGANHRGNLSDWVLLKDNHLALLGIEEAVRRARDSWPARTVHVECDSIAQVHDALRAGADAILLDNMSPGEVRACVEAAESHARTSGVRRPLLEISGRVSLDNVASYSGTGADLVSTSSITASARTLDIGLDIQVGD